MGSGHFDRHQASGQFPQYGAIFMSDRCTRKECFERKLFGLPSGSLNFVRNVKVGMPLFLFDYQERQLYGVFEATTNGAMNVVPRAYRSSGKNFPAQVKFRVIWRCMPVPEVDFYDAIKENYYARNKFHFGLSWNQVQKLLHLFELCRNKIVIYRSLVPKWNYGICSEITESAVESYPESIDNSDPSSTSIPEKPDISSVSDIGIGTDLASDDYIPLPLSDVEDDPESPKSDEPAEGCLDFFQGENDDKLTNCDSGYQVKGLYSDCPGQRTSAFNRLSRESRLMREAKGPCDRNGSYSNSDKILERLDKICKKWTTTSSKRASLSNEDEALKSRKSVFSRLGPEDVKAPEIRERQDLKRERSWTVKNVPEIKGIFDENKEKNDNCHSREQKKRKLDLNSVNSSFVTETLDDYSMVPVLSRGCSEDTVKKASHETRSKNNATDEGQHLMPFPSICEGNDTQIKLSSKGDTSSIEISVTKPLMIYPQHQSELSTLEESTTRAFVKTLRDAVSAKSYKDGDGDGGKEDEISSPMLDVQTVVCPGAPEKNDI